MIWLWIALGVVFSAVLLVCAAAALHVRRQPPCPGCEARALLCQSALSVQGEQGPFRQAYYECLSCKRAFVRYDEEWFPIPRDELPSEWFRQASRSQEPQPPS